MARLHVALRKPNQHIFAVHCSDAWIFVQADIPNAPINVSKRVEIIRDFHKSSLPWIGEYPQLVFSFQYGVQSLCNLTIKLQAINAHSRGGNTGDQPH
jgi:hypothetical protein